MGHIITVGSHWSMGDLEKFKSHLLEEGFDNFVIVADDEMEAFEYDDLENVTIHEEEIEEEFGVNVSSENEVVKFLEENSLEHGME